MLLIKIFEPKSGWFDRTSAQTSAEGGCNMFHKHASSEHHAVPNYSITAADKTDKFGAST